MIISRSLHSRVNQGVFDGPYNITAGITRVSGTPNQPARRRTVLHYQATGVPVRELWSAAGVGEYQYMRVAAGVYFIVGYDHTGVHNGEVITDIVVPAPAP